MTVATLLITAASLHALWNRRHLCPTTHLHNEKTALLLSIHLTVDGVVGHLAVIAVAALIANTALRTLGWPRHHLTHITAASAAATLWTPTSTWCLGLLLPALALAALAHTIIAIEEPACRQLATLYAAPLAFAIPATTLRIIPTADHASRWVLIAAVAAFLAVAKYSWWLIWTRPLTESLRLAAGSNG